MLDRIKIIDIELSRPLEDIGGLEGYNALKGLVRFHGTPIGYVTMPLPGGRCRAGALAKAILDQHSWKIIRELVANGLAETVPKDGLRINDLLKMPIPVNRGPQPLMTVAVCTRDRTADLAICLRALSNLNYPELDILIVDNAPSTDATERLIRTDFPNVRYACEPRPGLDWARNRAILEARGEIIAYTDDDVVVDRGWAGSIARVFGENSEVMAVTGLVVPYELETEAQILFEMYGGFGRGFERKWYRLDREISPRETYHLGAGAFGTGANMAYRRSLFDRIGTFDPALDVGTVTNGGGDLDMFFRVLQEGHTLVYEPSAVVRHRHRREYGQLKTQISNNGIGFYSYLVRAAIHFPRERIAILRLALWWLWWWNVRRLIISLTRPGLFPRDLILAELQGSFKGLVRYMKARRIADKIAKVFHATKQTTGRDGLSYKNRQIEPQEQGGQGGSEKRVGIMQFPKPLNRVAVRTIDLSKPLYGFTDMQSYRGVQVFVTLSDCLLGNVYIPNESQPVSSTRLRHVIAENLTLKLLEPDCQVSSETSWAKLMGALTEHYAPGETHTLPGKTHTVLSKDSLVSVVVATRDRPHDLRNCLRSLIGQVTERRVEIVIVDNNPDSCLTAPVTAEFPGIILVTEPRKGLSYARNKGIAASNGDIAVMVDDDVIMPAGWLEKLIAPFARPDVKVVTGNIVPMELETVAQNLFELYGGLGRGLRQFEVNGEWFDSFRYSAVPTWTLGATANAAVRASIFSDPKIGILEETLGAGMPSGCSEDTYLFYKVLKAGHTIVYEPTAYVYHKHRREMSALRRQLYSYSKGHVAYHLITFFRDKDVRALIRLAVELPLSHVWRMKERLLQRTAYPLGLLLLEIAGSIAGPWALWQSRRRVKREGRSEPYRPNSVRLTSTQASSSRPTILERLGRE